MRIISSFHDYYDSALAYGFDESRVYLRESKTHKGRPKNPYRRVEASDGLPAHLQALHEWARACPSSDHLIGPAKACPDPKGLRYSLAPLAFSIGSRSFKALWLVLTEPDPSAPESPTPPPSFGQPLPGLCESDPAPRMAPSVGSHRRIVFDGPVFDSKTLCELIGPWVDQARDDKKRGRSPRGSYSYSWDAPSRRRGLLAQMEWLDTSQAPAQLGELMAAAGCAAAVADSSARAVENPCLASFQFYRGLDPYSCIQEISMFVSNLANPERPLVDIEDRYKIVEHGFDQASFRKQPTKSAEPSRPKRPHPDKRSMS